MQMTAAVINAGIGDLSLGLEMAGFHIKFVYEADPKAASIHGGNFSTPVFPQSLEEIEVDTFPEVDLLALRIYQSSGAHTTRNSFIQNEAASLKLRNLLDYRRPRAFLLLVNPTSFRSDNFIDYIESLSRLGYHIAHQKVDVGLMTGYPVKESMTYIVGVREDIPEFRLFEDTKGSIQVSPERFFDEDKSVDPWYHQINWERTPVVDTGSPFLCWKNNAYTGSDLVQWNPLRVPLVRAHGNIRRITHNELALLKGFPVDYNIAVTNKKWLYEKLMYAGNVIVIKQIAGITNYVLSSNPWRSQQKEGGQYFEDLFGRYLNELASHQEPGLISIEQTHRYSDHRFDFSVHLKEQQFVFELKYYRTNTALTSKLRNVCKRMSHISDSIPILVIANEVPQDLKEHYLNTCGVHIWDVKNLLWLFGEIPDIQNDFIAFLDYSVDHIDPKKPTPELIQSAQTSVQKELDWKEKLLQIAPGANDFSKYESVCTDILKYILGDYLTLWKMQECSNDDLYRFDLCCKIKSEVNQDFFDTIKNYFRTKYIVFEFKNHKKPITQKEIYTTEKYLYEKALRKVAIIISRSGADDHALWAAKGSLRETGKLILCLSDAHLLEMIDMKDRGEYPAEFLSALLDDLLVHLEK